MAKKPKRLRGQALALHLEKTSQYQRVQDTQRAQKYLPADYKLSHGIPLNIYDAARSYRETQGEPDRPLREVLKDDRFRNAWGTFKGGHRWKYSVTKHEWVKSYRKKGGIESTTKQKLDAAKIIGWYGGPVAEPIDKLRNISP